MGVLGWTWVGLPRLSSSSHRFARRASEPKGTPLGGLLLVNRQRPKTTTGTTQQSPWWCWGLSLLSPSYCHRPLLPTAAHCDSSGPVALPGPAPTLALAPCTCTCTCTLRSVPVCSANFNFTSQFPDPNLEVTVSATPNQSTSLVLFLTSYYSPIRPHSTHLILQCCILSKPASLPCYQPSLALSQLLLCC
jgi:hypothetical protein